jgi:transposase
MIRLDEIWLSREPLDMRSGPDTTLARVVRSFGEARPHCAYVFANKRANRMKVLVHDGYGIWLASRRLHQGKFVWSALRQGDAIALDAPQLQALVVGLPWQYAGADHVIKHL